MAVTDLKNTHKYSLYCLFCWLSLLCLTAKVLLLSFFFCNKAEITKPIALFASSNTGLLGEAALFLRASEIRESFLRYFISVSVTVCRNGT